MKCPESSTPRKPCAWPPSAPAPQTSTSSSPPPAGDTALAALDAAEAAGILDKLVIVGSVPDKGVQKMRPEVQEALARKGVPLVLASHVLSGAERGLSTKMGGIYPVEIIAHTLRMLSQGVKVCLECSVMALDAGAIPTGRRSSPSAERATAQTPPARSRPPAQTRCWIVKFTRFSANPLDAGGETRYTIKRCENSLCAPKTASAPDGSSKGNPLAEDMMER